MSVEIPKCAIVFGGVTPPQGDVLDLRVHLGGTKEVSSFECVLQNWDKKYSPGSANEIKEGMDGHIDIGRGTNVPQIITCRVEKVEYLSSPTANYVRVSGRCWGERIFRRVVTKTYENKKGEEIVKDIIDSYVGLSHTRDGVELIENTDTTYTKLEYENTPVFDILKFIAETADKQGVIGYDFRVAPDGKFEFFPKNSKTSPVSLSEKIEVSSYRKDIHRVRNKIIVYGAAEKTKPEDKDAWTETLDIDDDGVNDWVSGTGTGTVSLDSSIKILGSYSIKHSNSTADYYSTLLLYLSNNIVNCNKYPILQFQIRKTTSFSDTCYIAIQDAWGNWAHRWFNVPADEKWHIIQIGVGKKNADNWQYDGDFDWSQINEIRWDCHFPGTGTGSFWIDNLFFGGRRWEATQEDTGSQNNYGLRELVEVDEELHSDNACERRAKALLDHLKNPAEYLRVQSTVIDYGNTPLLPMDKIHVTLPNENVDSDFRIESVEYRVDARTQTLEITLELGKAPPLLADYLYGMRSTTVTVEKLARTKVGHIRAMAPVAGGGMREHGNEWHTPDFAEEMHTHVEADITDLDHDAQKIKGKPVDDSNIGDDRILVYKAASDSLVYEDKPAGGGGAHADTHCCGGSDPITGVICPSGLKHPDTYQIIMDKRGTNVPCLRPQYDGYGDLGKPTYKWAYIYADYLGTSSYRITNAYLNNLRVYSNANFLCSLMTRDILVDGGYSIQLPRSYGAHGYIQPASAGYSYVGTSTLYLKEMHATDFVTHSFKPVKGSALEKLLRVRLDDKLSFPEDVLRLPVLDVDRENVRRLLRDQLKREPSEAEVAEELGKPEYKGVNLVQLCAYLVEAIKELETQIQAIREASS